MINRCCTETEGHEQLSAVLKRFSRFEKEKEKEKHNLSVDFACSTLSADSKLDDLVSGH